MSRTRTVPTFITGRRSCTSAVAAAHMTLRTRAGDRVNDDLIGKGKKLSEGKYRNVVPLHAEPPPPKRRPAQRPPKPRTPASKGAGLDLGRIHDEAVKKCQETLRVNGNRTAETSIDGAAVLDDVVTWWGRFVAITNPDDFAILALWTAHSHLARELYTTPRLQIDSIMPGSGKTTVLDHLSRLCLDPLQAASMPSPALIPRLLTNRLRTVLLDEVDRTLAPDKPGVGDLIGIINSGYRFGATRPVLVPSKGGGWDADEMTTFAPLAMAGNNPHLPADTMSRSIRILLMPDIDGTVEDSDWELIEGEARALRDRIANWAESVRDDIPGLAVDLPPRCLGRSKEKWRPLARVAAKAGGEWPTTVHRLIEVSMAQDEAEHEAGLKNLPPGMVVMKDLHDVWPDGERFMPTRQLVTKLIGHNPEYWGLGSAYGKALTDTRLGRLIDQATKVTSIRPGGRGPRGYNRASLAAVWHRLGIGRVQPGAPGYPGEPGAEKPPTAGLTDLTGCAGLDETPAEPGAFTPPISPGRCPECHWHVATMGHAENCQQSGMDA
jgi:hypothetical protein